MYKFEFLYEHFPVTLDFKNKYFLEIVKEESLFIKIIFSCFKSSSLVQKFKWENTIGKPIASKIEPILILGVSDKTIYLFSGNDKSCHFDQLKW